MTDPAVLDLARAGAAAFGLTATDVRLVQNMVNASVAVRTAEGDFHLRIAAAARRSRAELESEAALLAALRAAAFRVPPPRPTPEGAAVWTAPDGQHHVTVTGWLPGAVLPNAQRCAAHFERVGATLGALHAFVSTWERPAGFLRPALFANDLFAAEDVALAPAVGSDLVRAAEAVRDAERALPHARGLVHGDPSFGNILFAGDEPALIDFDDCGEGLFAFDLAVVLAGAWGRPDFATNAAALLAGYESRRALTPAERAALPALMAARAATMLLWAARQDPAHPWITAQHERLAGYLAWTV